MLQYIAPSLLALIAALPLVFFFKGSEVNIGRGLVLIAIYQLVYVFLIFLPIQYSAFWIPESSMNWSGKLLATAFSIGFYMFFKNGFSDFDFIRSSPDRTALRRIVLVGGITLIAMCLLTFAFSQGKDLDLEKLFYQATMPGIDEELWRGLMLMLILPLMKPTGCRFGHPAVWFTTIIFALGHSLYFDNWNLGFAADAFIITGILGYILGWVIMRSQSILLALILHNLINLSTNLLEMLVL